MFWTLSRIGNYILLTVVKNPVLLQLDKVFNLSHNADEYCCWHYYMAVMFQARGSSILVINEVLPPYRHSVEHL